MSSWQNWNLDFLENTGLPVKQFVIYLGSDNRRMKDAIEHKDLKFHYTIINIQDVSYKEFINSQIAEEVVFALLCNLEDEEPEKIIMQIFMNLRKLADRNSGVLLMKYVNQLRVLAQLRDLHQIVTKIQTDMDVSTWPIDINKDPLYVRGGENTLRQVVINMIKQGDSNSTIRGATGWAYKKIDDIRNTLKAI